MSLILNLFLRAIAPGLSLLLGLLGVATLGTNVLGWFLFLLGVLYTAATVILHYIGKLEAWQAHWNGGMRGGRSFWIVIAALVSALFLSPLEYLYLADGAPAAEWTEVAGGGLVTAGGGLFLWARGLWGKRAGARAIATAARKLLRTGPYRVVRHPAYSALLLIALGLAVGYSSLWGVVVTLAVLLPSVIYRVRTEERLLSGVLGAEFADYAAHTKRLIPGIW